jgi:sulfatase modifying factor 1
VTGVSWFDAKAYCDWLGPRFHLPTEPMREWAARGGLDDPEWPWGNEPPSRPGPLERPDVVGGRANGYGLFNMGDGVHEWCAEWDASRQRRAARGGSWRHAIPFSRCAARSALDPSKRFTDFGFRVAASDGFVYDAG